MKTAFDEFPMRHGLLYDYSHNQFPTKLYAYTGEPMTFHKSENTVFVYASAPTEVLVQSPFGDMIPYTLLAGMYLSGSMVRILSGKGIAIERLGYSGQFMLGGPIEQKGRLKYIDGCTDSLLIPPVKYGDPCLNALYFPAGIDQTAHTHPSMRVGMIVSGKGECVTPKGTTTLVPGMIFIIHEDGHHKFRTPHGESMVVIAYHPDSDFGPKDEEHPMLNRTIVNGVSAKHLDDIRTK